MTGWIVRLLKTLRISQPFNAVATTLVRALLSLAGQRPEWVIRHLHRAGYVSAALPNGRKLRLWSRADDWVSNQLYWRGWAGYEHETVQTFFPLATRARVIFDVGAYVGYYTLLAAHANPRGRVFAFEPHPTVYERLRGNVRLNDLDNVECVHAAVGSAPGEATFFAVRSGLPTSSSLSHEFMGARTDLQPFAVSVISLDEFVRSRGLTGIDLVKIDTETTEPQVLEGFIATLRRDHPVILCEVLPGHGVETALEAILEPLGYRYYRLDSDGPSLCSRIEPNTAALNHLFMTPEVANGVLTQE
jgi:FkbM family methyltransferase